MNEDNTPELTADVIDAAFDSSDPEVRKLPLNSPELNAALEDSSKTDSDEGDDDAPAGDDEHEQDVDEDKSDKSKGKKPRARDRRIDQLTAKIGELQRSLEQRQAAPEQREAAPPPPVEKPKFTDYRTLEEYTEALTTWKIENLEQQKAHAEQIKKLEKQSSEFRQAWNDREKELKQNLPDYDEVVTFDTLKSTNPSQPAKDFLFDCEDGPKVVYNLLSDSELAEKFASASPVKQVAMLAKLEAQLESTGSDVKKNIASKAPEPPRSLPSGKTSSMSRNILTNAHEMSFEEWDRALSQLERNKKRR